MKWSSSLFNCAATRRTFFGLRFIAKVNYAFFFFFSVVVYRVFRKRVAHLFFRQAFTVKHTQRVIAVTTKSKPNSLKEAKKIHRFFIHSNNQKKLYIFMLCMCELNRTKKKLFSLRLHFELYIFLHSIVCNSGHFTTHRNFDFGGFLSLLFFFRCFFPISIRAH